MKLLFSFSFVLGCLSFSSLSQIPIHYVSPEKTDLINENSLEILKSRVIAFTSNNGISGEGGYSDLVIYPVISELDNSTIEGTQNLMIYTIEVQLIVKELSTKNIYGTYTKVSKGDGYNKSDAIKAAISKLEFNSSEGNSFIASVKTKIIEYYKTNCEILLNKANNFSKSGNYEAAISVCFSIPESVECYKDALVTAMSCYNYLKESHCKSQLTKADGFITNRMYSQAIRELMKIDPNTLCHDVVASKLELIDEKIKVMETTEKEKLEYERKVAEQRRKNQFELEKDRISALKDIALTYYKTQPNIIYQYSYIIR
jgi:hypothetical protein